MNGDIPKLGPKGPTISVPPGWLLITNWKISNSLLRICASWKSGHVLTVDDVAEFTGSSLDESEAIIVLDELLWQNYIEAYQADGRLVPSKRSIKLFRLEGD